MCYFFIPPEFQTPTTSRKNELEKFNENSIQ